MQSSELKKMSEELATNPDMINNISPEELFKLRNYLHPYGTVIGSDESWANISIVNWKEHTVQKFITTALIGYVNRLIEEYTDEEVKMAYDILPNDSNETKEEKTKNIERTNESIRTCIRKFWDRHFSFNPDYHIREAATSGAGDPERNPEKYKEYITKLSEFADRARDILVNNTDTTVENLKNTTLEVDTLLTSSIDTLYTIIKNLGDPKLDLEDKVVLLVKNYNKLRELSFELEPIAKPLSAKDIESTLQKRPPADLYHHFNRYINNHYEQLRDVCFNIYSLKPDIEYSIIYYGSHETEEKAKEYRIQHNSEFKTEVFTVQNNGITLLGPFKENRERIDFYNKNTEIMKQMTDQMEADHKLGADMMKKKVTTKKSENIKKYGPDSEALSKYIKAVNTVQALGVKKGLTKKEQDELYDARTVKEDFEVPDDAVQVDMFYTKDGKLERSKFYTQAEAPLHMQEGSEFADKYQPIRDQNTATTADTSYVKKSVVSRDGRISEVAELKKNTNK